MPGCAHRPAEPEAPRRRANDPHSRGRPCRLAMVADHQDTPLYRETDVSTAEAGRNTAPCPPDLTPRPPRYPRFREISGLDVCAVFYGHPGIFVHPPPRSHSPSQTGRITRPHVARLSAEDCLYTDLSIDPGRQGSLSFEAADFILRDRSFDPYSYLIIWQIGYLGNFTYSSTALMETVPDGSTTLVVRPLAQKRTVPKLEDALQMPDIHYEKASDAGVSA